MADPQYTLDVPQVRFINDDEPVAPSPDPLFSSPEKQKSFQQLDDTIDSLKDTPINIGQRESTNIEDRRFDWELEQMTDIGAPGVRTTPLPEERGFLVPLATTNGETHIDMPGILYEPWIAGVKGMSQADQLGRRNPQIGEWAFDVAGAAAVGSIPFSKPKGALGTFVGRVAAENLSKAGDPLLERAMGRAFMMDKEGKSREEIWAATAEMLKDSPYVGVFKGREGKWRAELDDGGLQMMEAVKEGNFGTGKGRQPFEHPEYMKAYPDTNVDLTMSAGPQSTGKYLTSWPGSAELTGRTPRDVKDVFAHEVLGHHTQTVEGFTPGRDSNILEYSKADIRDLLIGNVPEVKLNGTVELPSGAVLKAGELDPLAFWLNEALKNNIDGYTGKSLKDWYASNHNITPKQERAINKDVNFYRYHASEGEIEARNVESRLNLTRDEKVDSPPWMTEDVANRHRFPIQTDQYGNVQSSTRPKDWKPEGASKHLEKPYIIIDKQTGQIVGSAETLKSAVCQ